MQNPISATLKGLLDRAKDTRAVAPLAEHERIDGKTALVTGANRGLGKAIAIGLAKRGARVLMACRTGVPGAADEVRRQSGSNEVEIYPLDLGDLESVVSFCATLSSAHEHVDIVVLNAGVVPPHARKTKQGFEEMFGVNYLANVLLVERLLSMGVLKPDENAPPRIVCVSSETHRDVPPIDFVKLGRFAPYSAMGSMKVYGESKLLLAVYAAELARRFEGRASVFSCCPGAVNTDIARDAPLWVKPLLAWVMQRYFRAPDEAAEPVLYLACAKALEGSTGRYLHLMNEKPLAPQALDERTQRALLRESEAMIVRALGQPLRATP